MKHKEKVSENEILCIFSNLNLTKIFVLIKIKGVKEIDFLGDMSFFRQNVQNTQHALKNIFYKNNFFVIF